MPAAVRQVVGARPLPERHLGAAVRIADAAGRAQQDEYDGPHADVRQVARPSCHAAQKRSRIDAPRRGRAAGPVDELNEQVHHRHGQQLVVEPRVPVGAEHAVQRDYSQPVQHAECKPPELAARGRRRIGEQQVHAQEDGDRDVGVDEVVRAGRGEVEQAEHVHRRHRRQGHPGHAEQDLAGQADQEDEQVDLRRAVEGGGDLLAPGEIGGAGQDQPQREQPQRERRWVEDVDPAAVLLPADQVLRREPQRDQQELEVEPVRLEPEEQVDAEDDRYRSETQRAGAPPRPRQQQVERVGEQQLGQQQVRGVVHLAPVPAPVEEDRPLCARLHVVLRAERHLQLDRRPEPGQQRVPSGQRQRRRQEGPTQRRVAGHVRQQAQRAERGGERQREEACRSPRDSSHSATLDGAVRQTPGER